MKISFAFLMALSLVLATLPELVAAQSLGMSCDSWPRNAAAVYCSNHGGCPKDGYCYFPDGTYCDLWAFYNGTCPGREYYEQMMWEAEAYSFLHSDVPYYSGLAQSPSYGYYPYGYYPYGYYPYGYYPYSNYRGQPGYWPYGQDPLSPASAYGGSLA
jgi:putative hemolysin